MIIIVSFLTLLVGFSAGYLIVFKQLDSYKSKISETEKTHAKSLEEAKIELEKTKTYARNCESLYNETKLENKRLSENNSYLLEFKGKFLQNEQVLADLKNEKFKLESENSSLQNKLSQMNTRVKLLEQEEEQLKHSKQEWESKTKETLQNIITDLSKKNLENVAKNNQLTEDKISEISKGTMSEIHKVINKVSSLDDDVKKSEKNISKFTRALLGEGSRGIGGLSEITLNNLLSNAGLRRKGDIQGDYDYDLQVILENKSRPDAVIYLPNKQIIVIDSKSSPYFAESFNDKDGISNPERQKAILEKIKERMNQHLNDLKKRKYGEILEKEIEEKYASDLGTENHKKIKLKITQVMFVQTEEMLYKIREADGKFVDRAFKENILVLSPAGLYNFLASAKYIVNTDKQNRSWVKATKEVQQLLQNLASVFTGVDKMGLKIRQTLEEYNRLSGSLNRNLLTRARNINKLGFAQIKELPNRIKKYTLEQESELIEVSSENYIEESSNKALVIEDSEE